MLVAVHCPIFKADGLSRKGAYFGCKVRVQPVRISLGGGESLCFHMAFNHLLIPNTVQLWGVSIWNWILVTIFFNPGGFLEVCERHAIAASVPIRRAVQRLMNIACEMNDVADGGRTIFVNGRRVLEHVHLLLERRDDAAGAFAANAIDQVRAAPARNVNEVPAGVQIGISNTISPGGGRGKFVKSLRSARRSRVRALRIELQGIVGKLLG